ncbi:MAG: DUF11 domain-containing protein, partial [Saprospiraceae bacterium]|nr:DUF11 domain-containing protein [Saprospiraceae bacterium]
SNSCDSTVILHLAVLPHTATTLNESICAGESFAFDGNNLASAGTYLDTLVAANGCDSVVTLNLTVLPNAAATLNETICAGESFSFKGNNLTVAGTYLDTLVAANGCDSMVTLNLTVLPNASTALNENICNGESFLFDGIDLTVGGTYMATYPAANGCDSVVTLNLSVLPTSDVTLNENICAGETFLFDGQNLATAGTYMANFTAANGCDSIVTLHLTVDPLPSPVLNDVSICGGGTTTLDPGAGFASYLWSTLVSTQTITVGEGAYTVTVTNAQGCTASATSVVTDLGQYQITLNENICAGESFTFDGNDLTVAGTYMATYLASNSCDSTVILHLAVLPHSASVLNESICAGDAFPFDGNNLTAAGTYVDTLTAANGCDSVITLNLAVLPNAGTTLNESICNGDSYPVGGQSFNTAGTHVVTLTASNGCDSVVTLNLTLLPSPSTSFDVEICNDETYTFDGQTLSATGAYMAQYTAANGCDSTVTLNLTVKPEISTTLDTEICDGDSLFFNGQYVSSAGTYLDTLTSYQGCDSFITLNLSINFICNPIFDLALRKTLATGQNDSVQVGQTITYTITVFNQGNVPAYNILVLDYLPSGLTFNAGQNPGWVNFGAGPSWLNNSSPLLPGTSISKDIKLVVNNMAALGQLNNYAEITTADDDPNGNNTLTDIDSNPNAFPFDDPGGDPGTPADDVITGNGTGAPNSNDPLTDEDDHDGAGITVYAPLVAVGNLVFHDKDNDGIFNNNDEGIENVQVVLYNLGTDGLYNTNDDQPLDTLLTNSNGEYLFTGLAEGVYYVKLSGVGIPGG